MPGRLLLRFPGVSTIKSQINLLLEKEGHLLTCLLLCLGEHYYLVLGDPEVHPAVQAKTFHGLGKYPFSSGLDLIQVVLSQESIADDFPIELIDTARGGSTHPDVFKPYPDDR